MSERWWRAYDGAVHDPKIQTLPPAVFKLWFNLLCMASKNDGVIPPEDQLKSVLSLRYDHLKRGLRTLLDRGLIDHIEGRLEPHNWRERQYKSDTSAERMKRHRRRKSDVTVTPPENRVQNTEEVRKKVKRADARYAFEGGVIKLSQKHFDDWSKAFSNLDLLAELTARDAWLGSPRATDTDRANWFISTSTHFRNLNQRAKQQSKQQGETNGQTSRHSGITAVINRKLAELEGSGNTESPRYPVLENITRLLPDRGRQ